MYKFVFFVPDSHLETVKTAVFNAGGGKMGNYSHCAWQTLGEGQFKPLTGSQPHLGSVDELTKVSEWRVELVVEEPLIKAVIKAMKSAHPYEMPAYDVMNLEDY